MTGVDTNVLARLLLADDPAQHRRARASLAAKRDLFIPITVLLELAWVLKIRGSTRDEILASVRAIVALAPVTVQYPEAVRRALGWFEGGMDIADAFHLALCDRAEEFLSFDVTLARRAAELGARPPVSSP